jgi:hypothetical protein
MTRRANCPECGVTLALSDEQVGQPIRCSNCRRAFKLENRPPQEGRAGNLPLGVIAAAVSATLTLGLAAGAGIVYLSSKPVAQPFVVGMPPAHRDAAPDGTMSWKLDSV